MRWHQYLGLTSAHPDRARTAPPRPAVSFAAAGVFIALAGVFALARGHGSGRWFLVLLLGLLGVATGVQGIVTVRQIRQGRVVGRRAPRGWRHYVSNGLSTFITFSAGVTLLDLASAVLHRSVVGGSAADLPSALAVLGIGVGLAVVFVAGSRLARRRGRRSDG